MDDTDPKILEELSYWLAFLEVVRPGLGFSRVKLLYEHFESLKEVWLAPASRIRQIQWLSSEAKEHLISSRAKIKPEVLLEQLINSGIQAFHYFDHRYPSRLREIHDPPLVLFQKGKLESRFLLNSVAVVGTRRPTPYGQRLAKEFAKGLAQSGVTVVSGMALGIDSLTHWGVLNNKGRTFAVLGTGVDICYPSSNRPLYHNLLEVEEAAVVSEFRPGTKVEKWHFPARNRLISGMTEATVVIEAGEDSGALITAKLAFDQGRAVFAVPGRVDNLMSAGANKLIAEDMAHLVTKYQDVMKHLNWASAPQDKAPPLVVELYGREKEVFELISNEPIHFDNLSERTGISVGELSSSLTMLELAGLILRLPGDWWQREGQRERL